MVDACEYFLSIIYQKVGKKSQRVKKINLIETLNEWHTSSVPDYLSVLIGSQRLKNFWGICENAQLGSNPSLNKLSNELFYIQNGVVNKKIWWFN
jgi:hypothetical protein